MEIDLEKTYNTARNQYESSQILLQLNTKSETENIKTIGIVDVDLYIPVLTYVFGKAQLDGRCAVVSMLRLKNEYYSLPCDNELLIQRLIKESVHELGHTYGLLHCMNQGCVMNAAANVEDIDQKGQDFCTKCRQILLVD